MAETQTNSTSIRAINADEVAGLEWISRYSSFGLEAPARAFTSLTRDAGEPVAWVAESGDKIAGFVVGCERFGDIAHIYDVCVHAQFRGREIEGLLTRAALESAREHACLKVVVHDVTGSAGSEDLIQGLGFVFGRKRHAQGDFRIELYLDLYKRVLPASG